MLQLLPCDHPHWCDGHRWCSIQHLWRWISTTSSNRHHVRNRHLASIKYPLVVKQYWDNIYRLAKNNFILSIIICFTDCLCSRSVTSLGSSAFMSKYQEICWHRLFLTPFAVDFLLDNYALANLTLPTSLVVISSNAFFHCFSLRAVIVPT